MKARANLAPSTQKLGQDFEHLAELFLRAQGLVFVARNVHSRYGEIDLIFRDKDTLVFVEVRFRQQGSRASAEESISSRKQQKIIQTAQTYLQKHEKGNWPGVRFDVVAFRSAQGEPRWIRSAFEQSA